VTTSIRVFSDYVCPWCYVGLREAEKLHAQFDVTLDWQPFELRPGAPEDGWAIPEYIRAKMGDPNNPLKLRAKQLGVTLHEREWIPSSRRAHECTEFARVHGKLEEFHAGVLTAYWTEGKDLHDWDVLRDCARKAGLDDAAMQAEVDAGKFKGEVDRRVGQARAQGVNAVPTFILRQAQDGREFAIQGAQEYGVFQQAMERLGVAPK
jgi:predicted DsbA family dithiol-disulfide isomerase